MKKYLYFFGSALVMILAFWAGGKYFMFWGYREMSGVKVAVETGVGFSGVKISEDNLAQLIKDADISGDLKTIRLVLHDRIPSDTTDLQVSLRDTVRGTDKDGGYGAGCREPKYQANGNFTQLDFYVTPKAIKDKLGLGEAKNQTERVFRTCLLWHLAGRDLADESFDTKFYNLIIQSTGGVLQWD
jgi:hypothetical protein